MNEGKARSGGVEARPFVVRALVAFVGLAAALRLARAELALGFCERVEEGGAANSVV